MQIFRVLVLIHILAASRFVSCASIDRHESEKPALTAVVNLFAPLDGITVAGDAGEAQDGVDDEEYYDDEEEAGDFLSGDYGVEPPRVAFSSKPQDPSGIHGGELSEGAERRGKGRRRGMGKKGKGKGKGKKRNPCLRKYKDFCIHGTCQYLRDIRMPSCVCLPDYSGERCHLFSLPTLKSEGSYSRTTALAVVAVVLSSLCLTVIAILLAIRYQKRGAYDVENEEKVKLGSAPHH